MVEFLFEKGYDVYGIKCRFFLFNIGCIDYIYIDLYSDNLWFYLYYGDLIDFLNLICII